MSTDNIALGLSSTSTSTTARSSELRAEDRQKLAALAAEFESLLMTNMLRDMRSAGRWSADEEAGMDTLGAETFRQTFDNELARYLSAAQGGLGLSQQLLRAFDAMREVVDGATVTPSAPPDVPADSTTSAATTDGRRGWNNMRLDAPAYGGSGAEYGGFNNDRAMGGGDENSVKDAFFRWTYGLEFNPAGKSKEEIGSFMRSQIGNAAEYGLNIVDVNGDQILIETAENGPEWVDVVQAAGSSNPSEVRWQWLCQSEFGVPPPGAAAMAFAPPPRQNVVYPPPAPAATATPSAPPAAAQDLRAPTGKVTSAYGWRQDPLSGTTAFHRGVDVRGAAGDAVSSARAGKVTFSGTDGGYGTSVVVEHAGGLSTRYAHLEAALVGLGDDVRDGQTIGLVGKTGRATAPHLHYEVIADGRAVNPLP